MSFWFSCLSPPWCSGLRSISRFATGHRTRLDTSFSASEMAGPKPADLGGLFFRLIFANSAARPSAMRLRRRRQHPLKRFVERLSIA